jgi:CheY-like chemotaxis protein
VSNNWEELHPQNGNNSYHSLDGLHILVVDDNSDGLFLTTCVLENYDFQVTTATSASSALEAVKQLKFDMLIIDIAMPDIDGYTLVNQIRNDLRSKNQNVPAIALTALGIEEYEKIALKSGFQGYVSKPLDFNILLAEIIRLVEKST